jgi:hypothetical protein
VAHDDTEDPAINSIGLRYVWSPDGDEIALTQSTGTVESEPDTVTAIPVLRPGWQPHRDLPATAPLTSEAG